MRKFWKRDGRGLREVSGLAMLGSRDADSFSRRYISSVEARAKGSNLPLNLMSRRTLNHRIGGSVKGGDFVPESRTYATLRGNSPESLEYPDIITTVMSLHNSSPPPFGIL